MYFQARQFWTAGHKDEAQLAYRLAISLDSKLPHPHFDLATLLDEMGGDRREILDHYQAFIALAAGNPKLAPQVNHARQRIDALLAAPEPARPTARASDEPYPVGPSPKPKSPGPPSPPQALWRLAWLVTWGWAVAFTAQSIASPRIHRTLSRMGTHLVGFNTAAESAGFLSWVGCGLLCGLLVAVALRMVRTRIRWHGWILLLLGWTVALGLGWRLGERASLVGFSAVGANGLIALSAGGLAWGALAGLAALRSREPFWNRLVKILGFLVLGVGIWGGAALAVPGIWRVSPGARPAWIFLPAMLTIRLALAGFSGGVITGLLPERGEAFHSFRRVWAVGVGWALGMAVGASLAALDYLTSRQVALNMTLVGALAGAIGGSVMVWQLRKLDREA
jgi:hypothetical protein